MLSVAQTKDIFSQARFKPLEAKMRTCTCKQKQALELLMQAQESPGPRSLLAGIRRRALEECLENTRSDGLSGEEEAGGD